MSAAFEVRHLSVAYGNHQALDDASVEFGAGRLTAIVGPNGAGKSTLMKGALGLVPRQTGEVLAFGRPYRNGDPRVGYMPQREEVDWDFPISVAEVALMGTYGRLGPFSRPGATEKAQAERALEQVGLLDLRRRQIGELSGGQQQRVFLARALAQNADLTFMDEPFAGVDAATEQAILEVFRRLRAEGKAVVAIHHELESVPEFFDDVVLLNQRVVAAGPVAEAFTLETIERTYGHRLHVLGTEGALCGPITPSSS